MSLFDSIDKDNNGKLDKLELGAAFRSAGLTVSSHKLDQFFREVDKNNDGVISFEEWRFVTQVVEPQQVLTEFRDFLLFLPVDAPGLKAVLSYYSSVVTLNAEGDSMISDDTVQGLGTALSNFVSLFFGSLVQIASPPRRKPPDSVPEAPQQQGTSIDPDIFDAPKPARAKPSSSIWDDEDVDDREAREHVEADLTEDQDVTKRNRHKKMTLTSLLPDPGYFAAGGIAGVVSRTATAPLDRLKVYLIANTGNVTKDSLEAVKKGDAMAAAKHFGRPLLEATKELWRAGGWRSLFAGDMKDHALC